MNNHPINIIKLNDKELKKFNKVKHNELFIAGDLLHVIDDEYAEISKDSKLLKMKVNDTNIVYRKK
jgi:hypothetical protein